jgi:hypothetical protein
MFSATLSAGVVLCLSCSIHLRSKEEKEVVKSEVKSMLHWSFQVGGGFLLCGESGAKSEKG